jgi:hypothetical protein
MSSALHLTPFFGHNSIKITFHILAFYCRKERNEKWQNSTKVSGKRLARYTLHRRHRMVLSATGLVPFNCASRAAVFRCRSHWHWRKSALLCVFVVQRNRGHNTEQTCRRGRRGESLIGTPRGLWTTLYNAPQHHVRPKVSGSRFASGILWNVSSKFKYCKICRKITTDFIFFF